MHKTYNKTRRNVVYILQKNITKSPKYHGNIWVLGDITR